MDDEKLIQGLTLKEVRAIATAMDAANLPSWHAWQEGWDIWRPLVELDDLIQPISRAVRGPLPDVDEGIRTNTVTEAGIISEDRAVVERNFKDITLQDESMNTGTAVDLEVLGSQSQKQSKLKKFIKRNFTRYKKNLKIQITGSDGQIFTTNSIDISVGGIQLADPLPSWVVGYNQVKIIDSARKQAIEVTCSVVEDQDPHLRTRLEILPLQKKEEELHFDKWLAA